jgi:hypothetical protein
VAEGAPPIDWAVAYGPELAGEVVALHHRVWPGSDIADPLHHRWQYQDNPAGLALAALARDRETGQVVSQFGVVPLRMWIFGAERRAGLALNVATDVSHRGRGLFTGLARVSDGLMKAAGVEHAWAFPNVNSFPGFISRLGYTHMGDVPLLARPVNVRRLVQRRVRVPGVDRVAGLLARPFLPPLARTVELARGVGVEIIDEFDGRFDELWERVRGRSPVMVMRDARYLEWRFKKQPLRRYHGLLATVDGAPAGYVVLRTTEIDGMRSGLIVDLVVADERAGTSLVSAALAWCAGEDLDLLGSLMLPTAPEHQLLRRAKFRPLPPMLMPRRFRVVARGGAGFCELKNWHLTMGDYDVV